MRIYVVHKEKLVFFAERHRIRVQYEIFRHWNDLPLRRLFQWCVILRKLQQTPGTYLLHILGVWWNVLRFTPKKLRWLAGKFSMNEHVFPCISYWKIKGCSSHRRVSVHSGVHIFSCFWIRDEIQVEGRLSCPPSVVATRSIRYLRVVFSTKMDDSDFVC